MKKGFQTKSLETLYCGCSLTEQLLNQLAQDLEAFADLSEILPSSENAEQ
jgi:hypothetical protein